MNYFRSNSLRRSFRVLQGTACLLLIFLIIQGLQSWRVCQEGTQATGGLVTEGLPSLRYLASFEANQALYRLHSYEMLFAQEQDRAAKAALADGLAVKNRELIAQLKLIFTELVPIIKPLDAENKL